MAEQTSKPVRITGRAFLEALRDAGVIRPDDYARHVVIDAHLDRSLRVLTDRIGDERALRAVPTLAGIEVTPVVDEDAVQALVNTGIDETEARDGLGDLGKGKRTDLDETRRLLYMSLVAGRTKRYNLAGTLANAIRHHHGQPIDLDELLDHVVNAVEGNEDEWVRGQIERITDELGD